MIRDNRANHLKALTLALVFALFVSGCATSIEEHTGTDTPKLLREQLYQLENFQLTGKLGFRNPDEAFSVAVNRWRQQADRYEIELSSTFLGLGAAQVSGTAAWIEVQESGEEPIQSYYPNETLEQLLGMPLPIQRIRYWIRGIPAPQSPAEERVNQRGLVDLIEQDGWSIELDRYHDVQGLALPGRIKISQQNTRITLAVSTWAIL